MANDDATHLHSGARQNSVKRGTNFQSKYIGSTSAPDEGLMGNMTSSNVVDFSAGWHASSGTLDYKSTQHEQPVEENFNGK